MQRTMAGSLDYMLYSLSALVLTVCGAMLHVLSSYYIELHHVWQRWELFTVAVYRQHLHHV